MKTTATILVTAIIFTASTHAASFFVSTDGKEDNPGSRAKPFATLQQGFDRCEPGDECVVLPGNYAQDVNLTKSGSAEKPIIIRAEGDVTINGTDRITGQWEKHRDNIYRIRLTGPTAEQAFLKSIPLSPARWPNARFEDTWIRSKWALSAEGSHKDLMISDELAKTGIDWAGAIAVLNVGHQYKTWTRKILSHGAGRRSFTYALEERLGDGKDDGRTWWNDRFYITGTIKALDLPGEFFHDIDEGYFYLVTEEGKAPESGSICVKRRDYGITAKGVNNIHIKGFTLFGCALQLQDVEGTVVEECDIRFPSYTLMIGDTMPAKQRFQTPTVFVSGNRNIFRKLHVAYAYGTGIRAAGCSNLVEECIVHDACWSGTINHSGISIRSYKSQNNMTHGTVRHCTVYNTGNVGIYYTGGHNTVEYNHVHHTGLACHDIAAIHTGSPATAGSVAHHNWIHHSMGLGMRGDDQTRELTVHHNLVWNCDQGIIVKGNRNKVYNNTILGENGHGCLTIPTRQEPKKWWTPHPILPVQNINSLFFNNYCEEVSYRHEPIPQNAGIIHNITYKDKTPYTNSLVKVNETALKSGAPDARPKKDSVIIDAGMTLEGITADHTGRAPDAGAYEFGKPAWKAGATRTTPKDIIDLPIEAEVARSWAMPQKQSVSIPLPAKLRNSKQLNAEFKKKLQKIYDSCWTKEEIEKRKIAIRKRGQPDSADYAPNHKIVVDLHKQAQLRFIEKAQTELSGDECELFLSVDK